MKLKILRQQLDKSQQEVAQELGMPRTKYARYELGTSEPSLQSLIQLADYFHTTIDHLVGHEVPYLINKAKYNSEQLAVIEELEKLNKEQCFALLAFIEGMKSGKARQDSIIAKLNGGNNEFNAN